MDFLFYDNNASSASGWKETLKLISGEAEGKDIRALTRTLVSFADRFGLTGNVWQQWLTYILMTHENAFTMACERIKVSEDATIMKLAAGDLECFAKLFGAKPEEMSADSSASLLGAFTDYTAPHLGEGASGAGKRIAALCGSLAGADRTADFIRIITGYYEVYGVGIYGLYKAFRVDDVSDEHELIPVTDGADVTFDDLIGYESQKQTLKDNTEAFVRGAHANNVLLYGDSGTGKSTSIHALMHDYYDRGLRLVEISRTGRRQLPQVMAQIKKRNYRFIIFLDDLSFEENESDYKELKAMLEGALESKSDRVVIYATSNRRHLIRETWRDRNDMEYQEDIHHSDTMEEKLSLASRFGVTIYYSKPDAREYLGIVRALTAKRGIDISEKELDDIARKWELRHGGMSGRTASQLITWLENGILTERSDQNGKR